VRQLSEPAGVPRPDLPARAQAETLAGWLAGPRSRALRRAAIGLRDRVLEVGAGHCVVTPELQRRARGEVTCLDLDPEVLAATPEGVDAVCADCASLPFAPRSFDLVFFQNVLMWVPQLEQAVSEAARVLVAGGALVAIEPDYGGMMEHPDFGLRELWTDGLSLAGADPFVGRKLPGACEAAGLNVWVELAHLPQTADPEAVRLLEDLPLTPQQRERAQSVAARLPGASNRWAVFIHVPYFLIVATKR